MTVVYLINTNKELWVVGGRQYKVDNQSVGKWSWGASWTRGYTLVTWSQGPCLQGWTVIWCALTPRSVSGTSGGGHPELLHGPSYRVMAAPSVLCQCQFCFLILSTLQVSTKVFTQHKDEVDKLCKSGVGLESNDELLFRFVDAKNAAWSINMCCRLSLHNLSICRWSSIPLLSLQISNNRYCQSRRLKKQWIKHKIVASAILVWNWYAILECNKTQLLVSQRTACEHNNWLDPD